MGQKLKEQNAVKKANAERCKERSNKQYIEQGIRDEANKKRKEN
jgi:hypothetical protein